jgi:hypothetical protein
LKWRVRPVGSTLSVTRAYRSTFAPSSVRGSSSDTVFNLAHIADECDRIRDEVGRPFTTFAVVIVFAVGGLVACSSSASSSQPRCVGGSSTPITANALAKALAHQGLLLEAQKRSPFCGADGVTDLQKQGDANRGLVACLVRRRPIYAHPKRLRRRDSSYPKTQFFMANVECTIYPHGNADLRRRASLQQALRELERQLH